MMCCKTSGRGIFDELKNALFGDWPEKQRWDLWHRVDDAFGYSLYKRNEPHLLLGVALGMRMCGLEIDDIRQRMKWLV